MKYYNSCNRNSKDKRVTQTNYNKSWPQNAKDIVHPNKQSKNYKKPVN